MSDDEFNPAEMMRQKQEKQQRDREAAIRAAKDDPELQAILMETKQVQEDTLVSSRNAAKMVKDTIVVADKTVATLKQQGEQLNSINKVAEEADKHAVDSYESALELHKYKGVIPVSFKYMFSGGKKKANDAELEKANAKLDRQLKKLDDREAKAGAAAGGQNQAPNSKSGATGDAIEDEIDQNLDDISSGLDHLLLAGNAMGTELAKQEITIKRIDAHADHTGRMIKSADGKIQEFT